MSVFVTWCDPGEVEGKFAESLLGLVSLGVANGVVGGWSRLETGPVLDRARNDMTERFLATEHEWMLMIDSDMTFSADLIDQLLAVADPVERPIVGPLCYSVNHDGVWPVVFRLDHGRFRPLANPPENTMLRVDGLGTGCLLIHRGALEKMRTIEGFPGRWFDHLYLGTEPVGEDLAFCIRAHQAGIPLWCHTGIPIGHIKWKLIVNRDSFIAYRHNHRFIITGTGRCGTLYLAELLRQVQVSCGHETIYTPDGPQDWSTVRGDSSWMAAPFLTEFKVANPEGRVIHLLRNPLDVVRSLVGIGFFDPEMDHEPYRGFARRYNGIAFGSDMDQIEQAATFVVTWNNRIAPHADLTVKVEEMNATRLGEIMRLAGAEASSLFIEREFGKVPTHSNSRRRADLSWADMPQFLKDHATTLGYEVA